MTSTVTSKGQTVVPKALRDRFNIKSGATLDWQEDGQSLRVINLEPRKAGRFLEGLGRVPAEPRDILFDAFSRFKPAESKGKKCKF